MSSINSLSSYTGSVYQWQGQSLYKTATSKSSQSNTVSSSLNGSSSMIDQVSSMIELTKYAMDAMGVAENTRVSFSQLTKYQQQLENEFNEAVKSGLENLGLANVDSLVFSLDENGILSVTGSNASDTSAAQAWLNSNTSLGLELREALEKHGIENSAEISFRLDGSGQIELVNTSIEEATNAELENIRSILATQTSTGSKIRLGMENLGVDKNVAFTIQVNDDGSVTIYSNSSDREKIQQFFDDNPELVTTYRQIEALSGIDDARQALQLSPSEMRKRIQIESMASWWASSDDSSSYFGSYSNNSLSLLSGLNISV